MPLRRIICMAGLTVCVVLAGCGLRIPNDPDGTLDRIAETHVLRAGASPAGSALIVDGEEVSGPVVTLIEGFARRHDADVDWTVASEEVLAAGLRSGQMDLAVGGMSEDTPWADRVAVTRGYSGLAGIQGRLVVLLPPGENALQAAVERYLDEQTAE